MCSEAYIRTTVDEVPEGYCEVRAHPLLVFCSQAGPLLLPEPPLLVCLYLRWYENSKFSRSAHPLLVFCFQAGPLLLPPLVVCLYLRW